MCGDWTGQDHTRSTDFRLGSTRPWSKMQNFIEYFSCRAKKKKKRLAPRTSPHFAEISSKSVASFIFCLVPYNWIPKGFSIGHKTNLRSPWSRCMSVYYSLTIWVICVIFVGYSQTKFHRVCICSWALQRKPQDSCSRQNVGSLLFLLSQYFYI